MNIETIVRFLYILACLYIVYKFLGPVFMEIISEKLLGKKLNEPHDIDEMIRRKQAQLQGAQESKELFGEQDIKAHYHKLATDMELGDKEREDAKAIFKILNDSQWGESQEIKKWTTSLSQKMGIELKENQVFKEVLDILKGKYHSEKTTLSVSKLKRILHFSIAINAINNQTSPYTRMLASKVSTSEQVIQAATYITLKELSDKIDFSKVISSNSHLFKGNLKKIPDKESIILWPIYQDNLTVDQLIKKILENAKKIKPLTKIVNSKDLDIHESLKLFELNGIPNSRAELNKKHRDLKKIYHPDKTAQYNLPKEIEKIATENYQMIQRAYEIILKKVETK